MLCFFLGLNFVLRSVEEQYNLKPEQFVKHPSDPEVYFEYVNILSSFIKQPT